MQYIGFLDPDVLWRIAKDEIRWEQGMFKLCFKDPQSSNPKIQSQMMEVWKDFGVDFVSMGLTVEFVTFV